MVMLKIYDTPEARSESRAAETLTVISKDADGVLAHKGPYIHVFLPWQYLQGYRFKFYERRSQYGSRYYD